MKKLIIGIVLLFILFLDGCTTKYDNPDTCKSSFSVNVSSQYEAMKIYKIPNCYSWGSYCGDNNCFFVECCNDVDVKYMKEKL